MPFQVSGECGGVEVVLIPGPRGLGLVASETAKLILGLAGVKDCWTDKLWLHKNCSIFCLRSL